MLFCGIIAEYNPFHAGHAYQCAQIRQMLPDCCLLSVMSGNYVQRGDMAIWEKYQRAAFAVQSGGPDLILELSLPSALGSAEYFASGAVRHLLSTGLLTHLSFGSECGEKDLLVRAAQLTESETFIEKRKLLLDTGLGYAAASYQAMGTIDPDCAQLLCSPNDTLGIQYIRSLLHYGAASVAIIPVTRIGVGHDSLTPHAYPSASFLRRQLFNHGSAVPYLPAHCSNWERHALSSRQTELLSYLRRLTVDDLRTLPHISEGLEYRLHRAIQQSSSFDECVRQASSKRYPASRIRRLLLSGFLDITQEHAASAPQYLRVLAFNNKGRTALRAMKRTASVPVITKPLSARNLIGDAKQLWELEMRADDLYHFPKPAGTGWKQTAFYQKNDSQNGSYYAGSEVIV